MPAISRIGRLRVSLRSDRGKFIALALFFSLTFILGGGSRDDIQSLVILRPLAILFAAYALSVAAEGDLAAVRVPFYLLVALILFVALQLVPLPPGLWRSLPGREFYSGISEAAGLGHLWRPLSLSPSKTLNSLFSLTVPFAAICLVGIQSRRYRRKVVIVLAGLISASALWGLLQLSGSSNGPLYFYRITNEGLPVGLFANRNHQAAVLAAGLPLIAYLGATAARNERRGVLERIVSALLIMLLVPAILMTGSRAGLLCLAAGIIAAAVIAYVGWSHSLSPSKGSKPLSKPLIAIGGGSLLILVLGIVVMWFGRALAIERMLSSDEISDLRGELLPTLIAMAKTFFPVGSGFGSFEHVYDAFEPIALLRDQYLNQAHNDWLQLVIEGGLLAALLLIGLLIWFGGQIWITVRGLSKGSGSTVPLRLAALSLVAIIGIASVFDYPLRVPSVMVLFAASCAILASTARGDRAKIVYER